MPDQIFAALAYARNRNAQLEAPQVDGEAVLDARDEGETLRSLARLRNAVVLRSGLEHETIDKLTHALRAIWSNAVEWGNRRRLERVASLKYSLTDSCLSVTVTDEAGWLEGRRQVDGNPLGGLVPGGLFDEIVDDSSSRSIQLVKRFRPS
jgi:anti-sigma regulatory factor (Ser/Thr protein kinase)